MPRLADDTEGKGLITLQSGFGYSPIGINRLVESEYTFLHLVYDISGSVDSFGDKMKLLHETIMAACKDLPTSQNLIVRTILFSMGNITEVHGFELLADLDEGEFPQFNNCMGGTNLYDAVYAAIESCKNEGDRLYDLRYDVNGVIIIVTDGCENDSRKITDPSNIKEFLANVIRGEKTKSLTTVLVGVADPKITDQGWYDSVSKRLDDFSSNAGLDKYVEIGGATKEVMLKLAWDISQVTSEVSQRVQSQLVF